MLDLLRPNGELGSQPCFKCKRVGLNTAAKAFMDEGAGLCEYHYTARRWGVTKLSEAIMAGNIIHPTDFANQQRNTDDGNT